ncbi:bifunctional enzyme IspD/IspF [Methylocystaceae bacterium]|nr:bifunctional enzyme IspD/IspF [Methylocystaceae bacterium]
MIEKAPELRPKNTIAYLVVAAGRGSRAGEGIPKQYRFLGNRVVLSHTLSALHVCAPKAIIQVVIHADDQELYEECLTNLTPQARALVQPAVFGGATRQESVRLGLEALANRTPPDVVLIHDAARPFVDPAIVERAVVSAQTYGAAAPGVALTDTVKQVNDQLMVVATPDRHCLRAVQTPQAFQFLLILEAHRKAADGLREYTDDAMIAEFAGYSVHLFLGDTKNFKLTTPEDFDRAMDIIKQHTYADLPDIRTGQGYDVHAFEPGDQVWLGGVEIAHVFKLAGHSDADVLMHAITDALLGAIAEGDIGAHFPPSDPRWKGAASRIFLKHACQRIRERGGMIAHLDATIICEAPKIGPHRDRIRHSLAALMALDVDRVAIKATTTEGLGFTGRKEGIAALAIATIRLPS